MSGPDDNLHQIVTEFRALREADQRAVLSRLRFDERLRFEAVLHPGAESSGVSPDLAALARGEGAGVTDAARAALSAALGEGVAAPLPVHRPSLIDRLWRR
ncbi:MULTISPECIES: hypothetical protein [unclassified Sphingomonas]|uniref:hypothetical protein n=1 Tax=unclassified Sphingomonas TaxID=196159 RepID=UPI0006FACB5A|nr:MULTISPECIES: hypothetical protein [unclassified Sphingomonas]KQM61716.1 hypothetical protein ASE65_05725 [Sphingomonas sp. Leaf16]KQN12989.1 hypothetical protein ASE81_06740 [Sphingomonas sp. Leaf29]KQN19875.1 hypothetical protein ASE83_06665 [Sphingomonas sp. Leaf32]